MAAERIYLALKPFGNPPKTSYGARIINECCYPVAQEALKQWEGLK